MIDCVQRGVCVDIELIEVLGDFELIIQWPHHRQGHEQIMITL